MKSAKLREILSEKEHRDFISEHLQDDPTSLILRYGKDPEKRLLAEQVAQRQRVRKKLPSYYKNSGLILAPSLNLAQTSSEETAALKAKWIGKGNSMADLSAGMGIDCSFFAPNFASADHIEPNQELSELAAYNYQVLGLSQVKFHTAKAEEFLEKSLKRDFLYLDPSRRNASEKQVVELEDYEPNLLAMLDKLRGLCKRLLVKLSPMISIQAYLEKFPDLSEVWVISSRNECKEVCFYWDFESNSTFKYRTVNLKPEGDEYFDFTETKAEISLEKPSGYLYLPNASILKAGGQDRLGQELSLKKLAANTNLYSSPKLVENFPGRVFNIKNVLKAYDKSFKKGAYNIVSRNFKDDAETIRKKLKIKGSSRSSYLIACTSMQDMHFIEADLIL